MTAGIRRVVMAVLVALALVIAGFIPAKASTIPHAKKVLILNSYHRGYPGSDQFLDGFCDTLKAALPRTEMQIEYLDSINYSGKEFDKRVLDLLRFKYQRRHFDLIFSTDDYAFDILEKYRDSIFGHTPVVFCGTNSFDSSRLIGKTGFNGLDERPSFADTLNIILRLHPSTREIVAIHDTGVTGEKNCAEFRAQAAPFANRLRFTYLAGLRQEELFRRVRELHPGSVVMFFTNYVENAKGERVPAREACQQLAAICPVPIYSGWEFMLGKGIVGGRLLYLREHGVVAAKMAIRILNGTPPSALAAFSPSPNKYMFDYNQMVRFGIEDAELPPGSIVINRPPGFLRTYRVPLLLALCITLVLALIGIFSKLLKNRRELAASLHELQAAQSELLSTARKAGMAEIATNVLHNVGNVLNSVNISVGVLNELVRRSKVKGLPLTVQLINEHADDLGRFFTVDEKGKLLPGYLEKLSEALATERHEFLEELSHLTMRVDHIKDIVATQQSYAGAARVVEAVQVADLFQQALRMNQEGLARHQVKVVRDFDEVPVLQLDRARVLQILMNLISNAICAMAGIETITHRLKLSARLLDQGVLRLTVEDNGVGIPQENLSRIFSHGFTTRNSGHGFGLHSCALAATEMGGTLSATSPGAGKGAIFILELAMDATETDGIRGCA